MKIKKLMMLGLALACAGLVALKPQSVQADALAPSTSFQAAPLVKQLFRAIKENDLQTIYKMDEGCNESEAKIRAETPSFLLEKKLQEDFEGFTNTFFNRNNIWWNYGYTDYVRLNADTQIMEVRDFTNFNKMSIHEVYVKLKFKSDAMPESGDYIEQGSIKPSGKLKETALKLVFTDSGYIIASDSKRITDADVIIPANTPVKYAVANSSEINSMAVSATLQETLTKAEAGNAQAQFDLGVAYASGKDVETNYVEAAKWFGKAAEQGNVRAQRAMAYYYQHGLGVDKDYVQAVNWYRKAADQGNAASEYNLGVMYQNGWGVDKDYVQAVSWYRKSAEQNNSFGECALGTMYYFGWGVDKNIAEATKWFQKSADQGNHDAQIALYRIKGGR